MISQKPSRATLKPMGAIGTLPPSDQIAQAFAMSDEVWARHANPWSVWTRFSILPLLVAAIWSRVWIGRWALLPTAAVVLWAWLNPRLFKCRGPVSQGKASRNCCATQEAVGCAVTEICTILRRSWRSTMKTKRMANVAVGTVKKSTDTKHPTWFLRNVRHV